MKRIALVIGLAAIAFACSETVGGVMQDAGDMLADAGDMMQERRIRRRAATRAAPAATPS